MEEREDQIILPTDEQVVRYSHSKLKNQAQCPARNYFAELEREGLIEVDPAYPLVFGAGAHKGIEECLKNDRDPQVVLDEYLAEHLFDKFDASKLDRKAIEEKLEASRSCLKHFTDIFYPTLRDVIKDPEAQVEVKMQAQFRKGLLTGVADLILEERNTGRPIFADWKTGKVLGEDAIKADPQSGIYYWLAKAVGMQPPQAFEYVYLQGKNLKMVKKVYGPKAQKAGQEYWVEDPDNPPSNWKFSFPVFQNDESVKRLFEQHIHPLARAYEQRIIYKVKSDYSCKTCMYRTICPDFQLPTVLDYDPETFKSTTDEAEAPF